MADSISDEKILENLKQWRKRIILALYRHGELGAGELRSITGTPRGSKEHHYETLQRWGLMERVGEQRERGGNPERVFALTDDGTAFVEEHLVDTNEAPDAYAAKIDRALDEIEKLRGTVKELERTVEKQGGTVEDLEWTVEQQADEIEKLREERDAALDELRGDLEDALNGEYRELLKEDIVAELRDE